MVASKWLTQSRRYTSVPYSLTAELTANLGLLLKISIFWRFPQGLPHFGTGGDRFQWSTLAI
jgi:hypothetical protein